MSDQQTTTMKEMCETIERADFLRKKDGSSPSAQEIFDYSPAGELSMIFEWYEQAQAILSARENKNG